MILPHVLIAVSSAMRNNLICSNYRRLGMKLELQPGIGLPFEISIFSESEIPFSLRYSHFHSNPEW